MKTRVGMVLTLWVALGATLAARPAHAENWRLVQTADGRKVFDYYARWNEGGDFIFDDSRPMSWKTGRGKYSIYLDADSVKPDPTFKVNYKPVMSIVFMVRHQFQTPVRTALSGTIDRVEHSVHYICYSGKGHTWNTGNYLKGKLVSTSGFGFDEDGDIMKVLASGGRAACEQIPGAFEDPFRAEKERRAKETDDYLRKHRMGPYRQR